MPRKILLADDSVTAQNMGRKILTEAGYEVITVNNGAAAMKKIAEIRPDLVVLDVHMPGYSGLEVCQRLRETPKLARIPVLLTVGKLEPFRADDARRVRADAFVIKPFEATELLAVLTRLEDKIVPGGSEFEEDDDQGWRNRLRIPAPYMKRDETPAEPPTEAAPTEPVAPPVEEAVWQGQRTESGKVVSIEQAPAASVPAEAAVEETFASPAAMVSQPAEEQIERAEQVETTYGPAAKTFSIEAEAPIASFTAAPPEPAEATMASAPAPESDHAEEVDAVLASLAPAVAVVDQASDAPQAEEVGEYATATSASTVEASTYAGPRWIAEEVPVSEEESTLVLELEMQRAYAAFAAADAARWGNYSRAVPEAAQPEPAAPEPELPAAAAEPPKETTYDAEVAAKVAAYIDSEEDLIYCEIAAAAANKPADAVQPVPETASAVAAPEAEEKAAYAVAAAGVAALSSGPAEVQPAAEIAEVPPVAEPASPQEAELATAWDHWKHIRESVVGTEFTDQVAESAAAVVEETAGEPALASAPLEASENAADEANEIASIVDSVLADLKPKLMQEIAKKMGKGKKK